MNLTGTGYARHVAHMDETGDEPKTSIGKYYIT
jgi:hypothetical protein